MTRPTSSTGAASAAARCPVCGRPATTAMRPFCSMRCADVDLGRWLTAQYRLPDHPAGQEEETLSPDDPDPSAA